MKKLRVDRNLYEALNKGHKHVKQTVLASMFFENKIENKKFGGYLAPLNNMTVNQFIQLLCYGYELEETKEEKLLKQYNLIEEHYEISSNISFFNYLDAIEYTLNTLEIKIKGINA